MNAGILGGLRVVEGSAFVAAPLGGMTLAQLGADVIRFYQKSYPAIFPPDPAVVNQIFADLEALAHQEAGPAAGNLHTAIAEGPASSGRRGP